MSKDASKKSAATLSCDNCGLNFLNKQQLSHHKSLQTCETETKPYCKICKIKFSNKKNFTTHNRRKHFKKFFSSTRGKTKVNKNFKHVCDGCHNRYLYNCQLKYHIRKCHFNLVTNTPYTETNVNQVWFEKVLNTDILVEIKKIGNNHILIRKLNENTAITPSMMPREVIDLRTMYPLRSTGVQCHICKVMCPKKELHRHMVENHRNLLFNQCDKCKCKFKKLTQCLRHVCPIDV